MLGGCETAFFQGFACLTGCWAGDDFGNGYPDLWSLDPVCKMPGIADSLYAQARLLSPIEADIGLEAGQVWNVEVRQHFYLFTILDVYLPN